MIKCQHCHVAAYGENAEKLFKEKSVYGYELQLCVSCADLSEDELATTTVGSFNMHGVDVRFNTMGEPC